MLWHLANSFCEFKCQKFKSKIDQKFLNSVSMWTHSNSSQNSRLLDMLQNKRLMSHFFFTDHSNLTFRGIALSMRRYVLRYFLKYAVSHCFRHIAKAIEINEDSLFLFIISFIFFLVFIMYVYLFFSSLVCMF
jgi:hypothetical protein